MLNLKKKKLLDTRSTSEILKKLDLKNPQGKTKISELLKDFHENGILLTIIFFALPIAIPLPYPPGFTTIIGVPLAILSIQMMLGSKQVYLPKLISNYELNNNLLHKISNKIVPKLEILERYLQPRLSFTKSTYCEQVIGFICFIASLAVMLPMPFTNAIPAQGIAIMSLGLLHRDGWVIIGGFFITIIGVAIAFTIAIVSLATMKYLLTNFF